MSNENNKQSIKDTLINMITATGAATRHDLEWLTSTQVPREERSEVFDALLALASKMTASPFHMHRVLNEVSWFLTNVLGLEKQTAALCADLATKPIDVATRRVLTHRLMMLRGTHVELMPLVRADEDEAERAHQLVAYTAARWQYKDPTDVVMSFVHGIAHICIGSAEPTKALDVAIKLLEEIRDPLSVAGKVPSEETPK